MPIQINDPEIARSERPSLVLAFSSESNIAFVLASEINARLHAARILALESEGGKSAGTIGRLWPRSKVAAQSLKEALDAYGASRLVHGEGDVSIVLSPVFATKVVEELDRVANLATRGIWLTQHKCSAKALHEAAVDVCKQLQEQVDLLSRPPTWTSPHPELT